MINAHDLPFDGRAKFGDTGNQLLNHNALRERINLGQIFFCKCFIHYCYREAARRVLWGKLASLHHANPECPEVFRRHHVEARALARGRIVHYLSRKIERHAEVCADDGHAGGGAGGGNSRQRANFIQQLPVKRIDLFGIREAAIFYRQIKCEDVVLPEPQIHAAQFPETMNHQARAR